MSSRAPAKQEKSATKPLQKMQGHTDHVYGVLCLPDKQRIITCSNDGSIRVWDLESGTQVGDAWNDQGSAGVCAIALSPDSRTVASGSRDSAVRLWDIGRGKVVKKWMGHTKEVGSVCWSHDGGRVVSGSPDQTFRVWDVKSGKTILGPIETGSLSVDVVCYSTNGKMIATAGGRLRIWDANTGERLKTLGPASSLAWTSDGKTLITVSGQIKTLDVATWTETAVFSDGNTNDAHSILLSPNERILASISYDKTARLWNLENNKPIGPPLIHAHAVNCVAFSADEKFLATRCHGKHIFTWDVSAIIKDAGLDDLLPDNVNTVNKSVVDTDPTRRVPRIKDARRIPPGFFDDTPHRVDSSTSESRGATEHTAQSRPNPLSWAQSFVSGILHRRNGSGIRLHVPIIEVPLTAGKPRNYHARRKRAGSSSRPLNPHTTQQHNGATQSNLASSDSSQQPPAAATASTTLPTVTETPVATGKTSPPDITIRHAGWRARFLLWVCCVPIQNTDGQH